MKNPNVAVLFLMTLGIVACQSPASNTNTPPADTNPTLKASFADLVSGQTFWKFGDETAIDTTRKLEVSLTLPAGKKTDIYVLYTNVADDAGTRNLAAPLGAFGKSVTRNARSLAPGAALSARPRTELSELRSVSVPVPVPTGTGRALSAGATSPAPGVYNVDDSGTFIDSLPDSAQESSHSHAMHLKLIQADPGVSRTLYVWVDDDCWDGADASTGSLHKVTQAMVQALADKFLNPNSSTNNQDVYSLVTGIVGTEWPNTGAPSQDKGNSTNYDGSLINGGGQIHIVLADLNPKTVAADRYFGGGLEGYFHAWNNQVSQGSNEKVMFAIDANSLANPDYDGTQGTGDDATSNWDLSKSYYPQDVISTLAHEFQHMIHFYQKQVRYGAVDTDPWINEMASMAIEDLVADQLGVRGPRGYSGLGEPSTLIWDGRIPLFNGTHDKVPLQYWPPFGGAESPLPNYSNAYAFGAWLTRNYGGPAFWHTLVQSPGTTVQAVVDAVNDHGGSVQTYSSLVRTWGLATFYGNMASYSPLNLSNGVNGFQYPAAGPILLDYHAGSINLFRYPIVIDDKGDYYWNNNTDKVPLYGPNIELPPTASDTLGAGATRMSWMDATTSGSWTTTLVLPPQITATVVVEVE